MLCRFVLLKLEEEWAFINFNVISFTINHLSYSSLQQVPSKETQDGMPSIFLFLEIWSPLGFSQRGVGVMRERFTPCL
jgi:hypothetical protein